MRMSYAKAYGIRFRTAQRLGWRVMTTDEPLPRVLEILWRDTPPARRARGLSRERIVAAAIELVDADGLSALSMARLAERLGCGTMSLYRHVANKDELVTFMLSTAPDPPPTPADPADWRGALTDWADGLWDVYHRHPWVLQTASAGPPADPGQLAWLDAGLAALGGTGLAERDKLAAVMAVLHYVRGAAALDIEAGRVEGPTTPRCFDGCWTPTGFLRWRPRSRPGCSTRPTTTPRPSSGRVCASCSTASPRRSPRRSHLDRTVYAPGVLSCNLSVANARERAATMRRWEYAESDDKQTADDRLSGTPAHGPTVMRTSRWTRTSSCCSARRATWRDGS